MFSTFHLQTYNVPDATEAIRLDVSTKPMVSLVWMGTLLYTLGGLVAWRRRAGELGLTDAETDSENPAAAPAVRDVPAKPARPAKRRGTARN